MPRVIPVLREIAVLIVFASCTGCEGKGEQGAQVEAESHVQSERMVGMYEYMADAGFFTECTTGKRLPVAMEAENAALEGAYLRAREEPGEAVLVTVEGRIDQRPPMEGEGTREHLILERFEQIWPGESCEKSTVKTPLENTYWKLVELNGARMDPQPDQREAHIVLRPDEKGATGFAGCNQIMGSYETEGDSLAFGLMGSTMMACPYLDDETAFLGALEGVTRYLILGESLALSGNTGVVARFRAVYLE